MHYRPFGETNEHLSIVAMGGIVVMGVEQAEADRRGLFLSDDVMDYLLTRFSRDMKHLVGLLDRLDEFALVNKRAVTVPLLKQMLSQEGDA